MGIQSEINMGMRCFCVPSQKQVTDSEIYLAISSFFLFFGRKMCLTHKIPKADQQIIKVKLLWECVVFVQSEMEAFVPDATTHNL